MKTLEERWTRENLEMVGGVPWKMEEVDGVDLKLEVTVMEKDYCERVRKEAAEEAVPRRIFIRKQDVKEYGYTSRCPGCVSILRGTARQGHSAECRRRMEKELGMTERAKRGKKKVGEYVERKGEEDEEVRRKRKNSEGETREETMEEEERVEVWEAEKRKMNAELTPDDVRRRIAPADIESPQPGPQPARGSEEEVLRS